jgi:transketolase
LRKISHLVLIFASDKPSVVGIASGKSVNLSVANQKSLGMNVTKSQLPNVNVADSFVSTMEEYNKQSVEGHSVTMNMFR